MKLKTLALTGASLLCFSTPALAGEGWYLGLAAGWSHPENSTFNYPAGSTSGTINLRDATLVAGSVGFKWPMGFRTELEFSRAAYGVRDAVINNSLTAEAGHVAEGALFANVAYDFPIAPAWALTIGGGIGAAQISPSIVEFSTGTNVFHDDTAFAYQLIAGVIWSVAPQLDLQLDFRYRGVENTTHLVGEPHNISFGNLNSEIGDDRHQVLLPAATTPAGATATTATATATATAATAATAAASTAAATAATSSAASASTSTGGADLHRLLRFRQIEFDG